MHYFQPPENKNGSNTKANLYTKQYNAPILSVLNVGLQK